MNEPLSPITHISTLLSVSEVFVYKVPAMKTSSGHRAEEWDLSKPIITAKLKVVNRNDILFTQLFDCKVDEANSSKGMSITKEVLFAEAPIDFKKGMSDNPPKTIESYVEQVIDSSRYFVIRAVDGKSGREAKIGIGFRERDDAIDYKSALMDYTSGIRREIEALKRSNESNSTSTNTDTNTTTNNETEDFLSQPIKDMSLKAGEKITININGLEREKKPKKATAASGKPFLLKKPPVFNPTGDVKPVVTTAVPAVATTTAAASAAAADDDDDWGDFSGA